MIWKERGKDGRLEAWKIGGTDVGELQRRLVGKKNSPRCHRGA